MYATVADLVLWYGAREMVQFGGADTGAVITPEQLVATVQEDDRSAWAADEVVAADAMLARIQGAINDSGLLMDSYLVRRNHLPLDVGQITSSPVPRICGALTRYALCDNKAPAQVAAQYEHAIQWLQDCARGKIDLPGNSRTVTPTTGMPEFVSGTARFGDTSMRGF